MAHDNLLNKKRRVTDNKVFTSYDDEFGVSNSVMILKFSNMRFIYEVSSLLLEYICALNGTNFFFQQGSAVFSEADRNINIEQTWDWSKEQVYWCFILILYDAKSYYFNAS